MRISTLLLLLTLFACATQKQEYRLVQGYNPILGVFWKVEVKKSVIGIEFWDTLRHDNAQLSSNISKDHVLDLYEKYLTARDDTTTMKRIWQLPPSLSKWKIKP